MYKERGVKIERERKDKKREKREEETKRDGKLNNRFSKVNIVQSQVLLEKSVRK